MIYMYVLLITYTFHEYMLLASYIYTVPIVLYIRNWGEPEQIQASSTLARIFKINHVQQTTNKNECGARRKTDKNKDKTQVI